MSEGVTFEELDVVREVIVGIFNTELNRRLEHQGIEKLKTFFFQLYFEERLHTLFIPRALVTLSERIFSDEEIRDLILNMTDQVGIMLSVQDFNVENLIATLAKGICLNKTDSTRTNSLINERLRASFYVDQEQVKAVLMDNFWLVCLILLYQFLPQTQLFQEGAQAEKQ